MKSVMQFPILYRILWSGKLVKIKKTNRFSKLLARDKKTLAPSSPTPLINNFVGLHEDPTGGDQNEDLITLATSLYGLQCCTVQPFQRDKACEAGAQRLCGGCCEKVSRSGETMGVLWSGRLGVCNSIDNGLPRTELDDKFKEKSKSTKQSMQKGSAVEMWESEQESDSDLWESDIYIDIIRIPCSQSLT